MVRRRRARVDGPPPRGPTRPSAPSAWTGCAACRPSAASGADDGTLVLVTHASPGSQTAGFDKGLDESVFTERLGRTDARVICCGHTHVPEVLDFGWKVVVNGGSAGYVFDGDPTASWALIDIVDGDVTAEIKRVGSTCSGRPTRSRTARAAR